MGASFPIRAAIGNTLEDLNELSERIMADLFVSHGRSNAYTFRRWCRLYRRYVREWLGRVGVKALPCRQSLREALGGQLGAR